MKKINKKDIIIFISTFIIASIIFIPFLIGHYATDTYNIINRGYEEYAIKYSLNDGRPVMCLISLIAEKINMPIQAYIIVLTTIALFVSCISVIKLKNIILKFTERKDKRIEYIILAISYIIIFNFAYLENLQFAECAVMSVSILLDIIVAQVIVEKNKNYMLKSILLTIISILFYQGTINWLITITFCLSIFKEKKINFQVIKNVFLSVICIGMGYVVNLIQIKITGKIFDLTQTRMGSIKNIINNFNYILKKLYGILLNTYNLLPKYALFTYIIMLLIYALVFDKKNDMQVNAIAIILVCIGAVFAPNLMTLSAFGTGRMSFSIGAMIGLIFLYIYCNLDDQNVRRLKISKSILYVIIFSYMILSITNYVSIMCEHKKVNEQDKQECETIGKWINEYEEINNIEVKNIVFINNNQSKYYYSNVKNKSALCYKALAAEWSRIGAINYYTNRKFNESFNISQKCNEYFIDKSWDKLDKEQLIFEEDTLYYCLY